MNRTLASGPLVWAGIILTTCLLLLVFQTALWLVLPVLLALVAYYLLSPWVGMAMAWGWSRSRAVFFVNLLLTLFLIAFALIVFPKITAASHDWRIKLDSYLHGGLDMERRMQDRLSGIFPFIPSATAPAPSSVGFVATNLPAAAPADDLDHRVPSSPTNIRATLRWNFCTGFRRCCSCPT
jgi:predicted PurR-regulated permease PerM